MKKNRKKITAIFISVITTALVLNACAGAATPPPVQDVSSIQTQAAQTVVADMTKTAPLQPEQSPVPTSVSPTAPAPGATPDSAIPVAMVPTAAPGEPSAVANDNTAIYSGPGEDYVLYGSFLGGQSAAVIGKNEAGSWWTISVSGAPNGTGWVNSGWVTVDNVDSVPVMPTPPVPPTTEMVPPGPTDPQATALVNTNVRSGPAANYPAYGIAPAGSTGRVIGKSEDGQWWVVRLNPEKVGTGYGWVQAQYTQASNTAEVQTIQNPDTHASISPAPPATGAPTATATESVNVRSGPGTNYPVLGVASPGDSAEVTGKSSDGAWWQVKIPTQYAANGAGWVSASYVIAENTGSVPVVAAPPAPPTVAATPPSPSGLGCTLISQTPADGTSINIGIPFNTTWVLKNTGSAKWDQGEVDVRYVGAEGNIQLHTGADVYDLTTTVQPGNTYNFTVSMIAPFNAGKYGEVWELAQGSKQICQFYVYITVP